MVFESRKVHNRFDVVTGEVDKSPLDRRPDTGYLKINNYFSHRLNPAAPGRRIISWSVRHALWRPNVRHRIPNISTTAGLKTLLGPEEIEKSVQTSYRFPGQIACPRTHLSFCSKVTRHLFPLRRSSDRNANYFHDDNQPSNQHTSR